MVVVIQGGATYIFSLMPIAVHCTAPYKPLVTQSMNDATLTKSYVVKINGFLYPNFMEIQKK